MFFLYLFIFLGRILLVVFESLVKFIKLCLLNISFHFFLLIDFKAVKGSFLAA